MANFKIMRNGLNTEIVGDPHVGQSSEDVTVSITDDGTYQEYDKKLYYSYGYRNQIYRAIADKNSSGEFIIPMTAFLEPGIVKLSLELSNGTNKPTCNACFIISTDGAKSVAASDILPDEETWQSYIQSYIKSNAEEFKGDTGPRGPQGEKGDTGSIANLKIGGINLLNDTKNLFARKNFSSNYDILPSKKYREFSIRGGTIPNKADQPILQYDGISGFELGDKFTFSFYAKGTTNSIDLYFHGDSGYVKAKVISSNGNIYGGNFGDGHAKFDISQNEWKRYYCAWKLASEGDKSVTKTILVRCDGTYNAGKEVFVCAPKLEREEIPTDWTPSLEDIENKFDNILARLEALESK